MSPTPRESPTQALYRAALGPLQTEQHLRVFERFDADGRARPSWNWVAALLTLDWLVYRRLWRIAGLYLLLWGAALALLLGLVWGRWPQGVTLGLLAAAALLATAVPGLYANAWLHGQVRQAVVAAVSAAPSLPDACDALRQRAPSLARFGLLGLAHLLLLAGLAAAGLSGALGRAPQAAANQVSEPALPPSPPSHPAPPGAVPPPPTPTPEPQAAPVVAMAVSAPAPMPEARPEPEPPPAPAPVPVLAPPRPGSPKSAPTAEPPKPPPATEAKPQSLSEGPWGVNVGLFADPANAERVAGRLKAAGLPVMQDTLEMPRGPRVRVRVGPLSGRAQARQAAERIRALGLEAQVFRQGASE